MIQRLALTAGIVGVSFGVWGTVRVVQGADVRVQPVSPKLTLEVVPAPKTKVSIQSDGYIPQGLRSSKKPSKDGSRNVFGRDNRVPMTSSAYPWSAIGRVEALKADQTLTGWCTGTLIAKDLVATNAHCVFQENGEPHPAIAFAPNLIDGQSQIRANVIAARVGTKNPDQDSANDWAVLKLDAPLGQDYGWMEWASAEVGALTQYQKQFVMAGYSRDFPEARAGSTAGVHLGCSIRGFEQQLGLAAHDCDMTRGASGGPIFFISEQGVGRIVALNSAERINPEGEYPAEFNPETANYGVLTQQWASAAQALRSGSQR